MSFYVNKNCPVCGEYMKVYTNKEVCEKCGYVLPGPNWTTTATDHTHWVPCNPLKENDNSNTATGTSTQVVDNANKNIGGLYGWICPKCGAVMSPYTSFCHNCTKHNWEFTCGTGGSNL